MIIGGCLRLSVLSTLSVIPNNLESVVVRELKAPGNVSINPGATLTQLKQVESSLLPFFCKE